MTKTQLLQALEFVLGADVLTGMLSCRTPLPQIAEQAALKAFREDWSTCGQLDTIRRALLDLQNPGFFQFEKE